MKRILIGAVLPIILVVTGIGLVILLQAKQPAEKALPGYNPSELIAYLPTAEVSQVRSLGKEPLNLSVHGTVEPFRELQLAAEVAGKIIEKNPAVRSGNNLKKGQVLYRIDPRDYELEVERLTRRLDQERAMLAELEQDIFNSRKLLDVAKEELELATASVTRLQNLKSNFSSAEELDQAKRNRLASMNQEVNLQNQIRSFETRKTRLESAAKLAETELSKAKLSLERTVITSPVSGRVVREQVEADSYVQRGTMLLVIEDTEKIEVACSVRMDQLSWLLERPEISSDELVNAMQGSRYELPPTPVDVCFEIAGRSGESLIWNGVLDRFDGNGLDPQSRTVPIRIRVDEPTEYRRCDGRPVGNLGPNTLVRGMFVNAVIKAQPSTQLLLIPKLAIKPAFEADGSNLNVVWKFANAEQNDAWKESEMAAQIREADPDYESQSQTPSERAKNDTRKPIQDLKDWQTGHLQIVKGVRLVVPYWDNKDGEDFWVCEVPLSELGPGDYVITNPLPGVKADGTDAIRFKKQDAASQNAGLGRHYEGEWPVMRSIVKWSIDNTPGINVMVIGLLVTGLISFFMMRREVFPEFELEVVLVSVPYPGASPADSEKGVCQPIEEAVRALDGIKRLISISNEGGGYVLLELNSDVRDVQKLVADVRSAVDRITNFPELAERPEVEQILFREAAIRIAVLGPRSQDPEAELRLREVAENIRARLLDEDNISQATIQGAKPFQIDVELSEDELRKHNLTLGEVANRLRLENIEMPGGQLRADGQEILLRGKNRREIGREIADLPIISQTNGTILRVKDVGTVTDEFDDSSNVNEVNGQPALVISVDRTADEDLLAIAKSVHEFVDQAEQVVPPGYSLQIWGDTSVDVADRMRLLRDNGLQGLIFVFILLALFLEFRLAFWVSLGIPICVLGAGLVLLGTGQTLNMLSMFAFLMALGIVVDDAIVVGENIYSHRLMGKNFRTAAIDGTLEVLPSVTTAIFTTVIAFMPFFFVEGVMGKFIAVMPVAIIAMLVISLIEAATALPCHLAHGEDVPGKKRSLPKRIQDSLATTFSPLVTLLNRGSHYCGKGMDWFGDKIYLPVLKFLLSFPFLGVALGVFLLCATVAAVKIGVVRFDPFPDSDSNQILAQVVFPDGTPANITDTATRQIEIAARKVSQEIYNELESEEMSAEQMEKALQSRDPNGPVKLTFRQVGQLTAQGPMGATGNGSGSAVGQVYVELQDSSIRTYTSREIINKWRAEAGEIVGAERVIYDSASVGPGGKPIEFKLLAPTDKQEELETAVEWAKKRLSDFAGVYDVRDDATPGKTEFQIRIKDQAQTMGITSRDLAETIRNTYYGAEVMRLQRGRHEVKLMVRYPEDERTSLAQFQDIRVRGQDGIERPITELAEINVTQAYSEINRLNQQRSITITADLDAKEGNSTTIRNQLDAELKGEEFLAMCPSVSVNWEGQSQQTTESLESLALGVGVALLAMYIVLVIEFRSYLQPMLIMCIIPFGVIGAAWGHWFMGLEMTLFSFFGLVALTGIVVNDSIVLVDFINARVRGGMEPRQALLEAGRRRLRPVFLTSLTTIGGLVPMLLETSFQAQFLVPMAASIAFGLMLSTLLVLFQVPVFFQIYLMGISALGFDPQDQLAGHREEPDTPTTETTPEPV